MGALCSRSPGPSTSPVCARPCVSSLSPWREGPSPPCSQLCFHSDTSLGRRGPEQVCFLLVTARGLHRRSQRGGRGPQPSLQPLPRLLRGRLLSPSWTSPEQTRTPAPRSCRGHAAVAPPRQVVQMHWEGARTHNHHPELPHPPPTENRLLWPGEV